MKEVIITPLLTMGPAIVLLIIQSTLKTLRPRTNPNATMFPDLGMDAHVDAVALLMGVVPLSTQASILPGVNDLLVIQSFVVFTVSVLLTVTGVLNHHKKETLSNLVGLGIFAFALFWDYLMIFVLTV